MNRMPGGHIISQVIVSQLGKDLPFAGRWGRTPSTGLLHLEAAIQALRVSSFDPRRLATWLCHLSVDFLQPQILTDPLIQRERVQRRHRHRTVYPMG